MRGFETCSRHDRCRTGRSRPDGLGAPYSSVSSAATTFFISFVMRWRSGWGTAPDLDDDRTSLLYV